MLMKNSLPSNCKNLWIISIQLVLDEEVKVSTRTLILGLLNMGVG